MRFIKETFERIKQLVGPDCARIQYTGANHEGVWFICYGPEYEKNRRAEYFVISEDFRLVRRQPHVYVDGEGTHESHPLLNVPQ